MNLPVFERLATNKPLKPITSFLTILKTVWMIWCMK